MFPYWFAYKSFTIGLGEKKTLFFTLSPRDSFHLISFFETTSAKQNDDDGGSGDVTWYKKKLRGLSPRANYTDRAAAAGRRS